MRKGIAIISALAFLFISPVGVAAHVVVSPNKANVGERVTFSVGVPNEKDIPTTAVRLVIPAELESVQPLTDSSWKIEIKSEGEGEEAKVTEIIWAGGSIPAGFRSELKFRGKVPASESNLIWKAYQTYADGTVVAWDADPATTGDSHGGSELLPYSQTEVVNDLAETPVTSGNWLINNMPVVALVLSGLAVLLSLISLVLAGKRRN